MLLCIEDKCYWFKDIDGTPKVIPEEAYDKGCTKYKNTNMVKSVSEQQNLYLINLMERYLAISIKYINDNTKHIRKSM